MAAKKLSVSDEYYIEGHFTTKSEEELAAELDKPLELVRKCVHQFKMADSRVSKLLARHPSGAVAMTGGASAASDESRSGNTELMKMIQSASERGDFAEAARLQEQLKKQMKERLSPKRTDHIHYVKRKPTFQDIRK